jgi:hypothetical protein
MSTNGRRSNLCDRGLARAYIASDTDKHVVPVSSRSRRKVGERDHFVREALQEAQQVVAGLAQWSVGVEQMTR